MTGAVPQPDEQGHVVLGAGDGDRQVLILLVVSVEHDQLLLSVRRVVKGVDVEREVSRRRIEGLDEQIHKDVAQRQRSAIETAFSNRDKVGWLARL